MILGILRVIRRRVDTGDRGFTLAELLIGSSLFMLLNVFTFTAVMTTSKVTNKTRSATDINEEARLVLNRMARELREASAVTGATNPGVGVPNGNNYSPAYATFNAAANGTLTFEVDFNNNNAIEPNAADPEVITYKYDAAAQQLLLQAAGQTLPVLASNVTGFSVKYTSRQTQYDGTVTGTKDSIVTWEELDADAARVKGNGNHVLDALELQYIDSLTIDITLYKGSRRQSYETQVDLRNRPY